MASLGGKVMLTFLAGVAVGVVVTLVVVSTATKFVIDRLQIGDEEDDDLT